MLRARDLSTVSLLTAFLAAMPATGAEVAAPTPAPSKPATALRPFWKGKPKQTATPAPSPTPVPAPKIVRRRTITSTTIKPEPVLPKHDEQGEPPHLAVNPPRLPETQVSPPKSPARFNPDPGQWDKPPVPPKPKSPEAQAAIDKPGPAGIAPLDLTPPTIGAPTLPPATPSANALAPDFQLLFPTQPIPQRTAANFAPIPVSRATGTSPVFGGKPVPHGFSLPRRHVIDQGLYDQNWQYPEYPLAARGEGLMPYSKPMANRWAIDVPIWKRYTDTSTETPYQTKAPRLWHPYQQSILKGDVPVFGQDIFVSLTGKNLTLFEARKLPTGSGISAALPNSSEVFGRGDQFFINNDSSFTLDIFKGETSFKPVNWMIHLTGVYNQNYLWVRENNLVDPDPRGADYPDTKNPPNSKQIQSIPATQNDVNPQAGIPAPFKNDISPGDAFNYIQPELKPLGNAKALSKVETQTNDSDGKDKAKTKERENDLNNTRYTRRFRDFIALQEAFAEIHFSDLSNNYDFLSSRTGIQPFVSDFRGFIFNDTNLGFRLFGNLDSNRVQYNFVAFDMLEKDTYSDLNTFDSRRQKVFITNVFKQDFLFKGYTTQFSFHANLDNGGVHYDKNDFITRPAPLGTLQTVDNSATNHLRDKDVKAFYFGWAGDGHIGRFNVNHSFYQVFGEDRFNGLAGRRVDINAQMASLELSYDRDWIRFKLSGFYASGDSNPTDSTARGFDTILDNPFFIGGPFSWYTHQGFNLAGTSVNLKQRDSLVPNLRTSKTEGQSNFVNPGVFILGFGLDTDITPKLKGFFNANYVWLAETKPIEVALMSDKIDNKFGFDVSLGFKYRPLLTENIQISAGCGFFLPGDGYDSIYRRSTAPVPGFGPKDDAGKSDGLLYNAFLTVTFIY